MATFTLISVVLISLLVIAVVASVIVISVLLIKSRKPRCTCATGCAAHNVPTTSGTP